MVKNKNKFKHYLKITLINIIYKMLNNKMTMIQKLKY